jgi:uncharacterized protein (DUF2141 family)
MIHLRCALYFLTAATLLSSCARQTSPSGGPKDSIPPSVFYSIPKNGTTNYKQQQIELGFDEFIALNNPKEQIIITPDVQKKYDIVARKRKVVLMFDNQLNDTTTYTINFRNSVQDITEKNNARNLKLAFSTGSYIDSLAVSGNVIDPLTYADVKQATVALYKQDTFNIFKHKPIILTETDDKGKFIIENLKPGKYFIYAILDKNKNLVVDSKNETYGFSTDTISLFQNVNTVIIPLQKLDTRSLKLISGRPYNTYFNIKTSKNLDQYKVISSEFDVQSTFGETTDNVKVYNPGIADGDSLKIHFTASDSVQNKMDTILYAKFSSKKPTQEAFSIKNEGFKVYHTKGILVGKLKYSKPLSQILTDSINYKIDSLHTINISRENITIDSIQNTIRIERIFDKTLVAKPIEQKPSQTAARPKSTSSPSKKEQHLLIFGTGAFISTEQDSSSRIEETVRPIYYDETGIIFVNVETSEPSFVVELLDTSFKLIKSAANKKKITFEDLPPAEYQIRLIIDTDKNGTWTPGMFSKKIPAEKTVLYRSEKGATTIKLKANFELGPMLIKY